MPLKRNIIFQTSMFWFHVSFRGCSSMAFFFPVKHGFRRQLKMLQEFQLRSCSTRTNVVRFLSGTWFAGVLRFWHQQKKGLEVVVSNIYTLRLFICFILSPCWKDSQIYHRVFFPSGLSTNGLNKLLFSPKEMGMNAMFPKTICLLCIVGVSIVGLIWGSQGNMLPYWKISHLVKAVSSP